MWNQCIQMCCVMEFSLKYILFLFLFYCEFYFLTKLNIFVYEKWEYLDSFRYCLQCVLALAEAEAGEERRLEGREATLWRSCFHTSLLPFQSSFLSSFFFFFFFTLRFLFLLNQSTTTPPKSTKSTSKSLT